jgi:hypothetical protein
MGNRSLAVMHAGEIRSFVPDASALEAEDVRYDEAFARLAQAALASPTALKDPRQA